MQKVCDKQNSIQRSRRSDCDRLVFFFFFCHYFTQKKKPKISNDLCVITMHSLICCDSMSAAHRSRRKYHHANHWQITYQTKQNVYKLLNQSHSFSDKKKLQTIITFDKNNKNIYYYI